MNISPAFLGFLRALGVLVIVTVLGYVGDITNLSFLSNPFLEATIASIALAIEHGIQNKTGSALFGAVKSKTS